MWILLLEKAATVWCMNSSMLWDSNLSRFLKWMQMYYLSEHFLDLNGIIIFWSSSKVYCGQFSCFILTLRLPSGVLTDADLDMITLSLYHFSHYAGYGCIHCQSHEVVWSRTIPISFGIRSVSVQEKCSPIILQLDLLGQMLSWLVTCHLTSDALNGGQETGQNWLPTIRKRCN